ncbi:branched-chain amino acid ABC transporter permease [Phreatobacter sp. AB_2022a]|uniref:branched-chain amino acid ABC transporter permease n=1 Tax=Phreatobacter sp. AB_2022a TaxID=3003134 RepID=UPI0022872DA9|nr:branched-chain amino acid ABC transporter permease [Phreatobacter sp. AB_2022a]MCZ0735874.1 branched-chain amino acid ABC transporter permease [Phreatobacter sp. AB_2022a]
MRPNFFHVVLSPFWWAALAALATLPLWLPSYYLHIATLALIYAGLASAWNIVGGLTGQISLAHSIFVGMGSVFASALLLQLGINLWLAAGIAAALSAAMGAAIAWIDHRFRLGHLSFALITLAFAEMAELVVLGWDFVGGASGQSLPRDEGHVLLFQFGGSHGYFWLVLTLAALALVVNLAIINAPLGYFLRAIRDNENAAQALGVGLLRNKMIAMAISAVLTSMIGTAYARYSTFIDPHLFASPVLTIEIVLFATIGGLGTAFGPVVGAILLVPLGELLRGQLGGVLPGLHYFIYGTIVVVVILALPQGIGPTLARLFRGLRRAPPAEKAGASAPAAEGQGG